MIKKFQNKHGDIIIKPLYGNGGAGVFKLENDDPNLSSLIELFKEISLEPVIVQKYISAVVEGDKRIILVDGSPVGAINRVPQKGEIRSNMHVGGIAKKIKLNHRDIEICNAVGPLMKAKGQALVGLDVIGGLLTEINLTSPTGVQEVERFDNINIGKLIWEIIEEKLVIKGT
jgi:glutathione synthase